MLERSGARQPAPGTLVVEARPAFEQCSRATPKWRGPDPSGSYRLYKGRRQAGIRWCGECWR